LAFDSQEQRRIMGHFAAGITVATTRLGDQLFGMTANAVTSLSLEPPLVLICVDKRAAFLPPLRESGVFALNILSEEHEVLSRRFAQRGPKEFSDIAMSTAATGAPIFAEAHGFVDCKIVDVLPGGDHDIIIGEILAGDARPGKPLLYYGGKYRRLAE
jgi:flavin reductase (DIM6/NTAB) family NADH-FMN oxidoreductase RutF